MRRALLVAAAVAAGSACYNFPAALAKCVDAGRCPPETGGGAGGGGGAVGGGGGGGGATGGGAGGGGARDAGFVLATRVPGDKRGQAVAVSSRGLLLAFNNSNGRGDAGLRFIPFGDGGSFEVSFGDDSTVARNAGAWGDVAAVVYSAFSTYDAGGYAVVVGTDAGTLTAPLDFQAQTLLVRPHAATGWSVDLHGSEGGALRAVRKTATGADEAGFTAPCSQLTVNDVAVDEATDTAFLVGTFQGACSIPGLTTSDGGRLAYVLRHRRTTNNWLGRALDVDGVANQAVVGSSGGVTRVAVRELPGPDGGATWFFAVSAEDGGLTADRLSFQAWVPASTGTLMNDVVVAPDGGSWALLARAAVPMTVGSTTISLTSAMDAVVVHLTDQGPRGSWVLRGGATASTNLRDGVWVGSTLYVGGSCAPGSELCPDLDGGSSAIIVTLDLP